MSHAHTKPLHSSVPSVRSSSILAALELDPVLTTYSCHGPFQLVRRHLLSLSCSARGDPSRGLGLLVASTYDNSITLHAPGFSSTFTLAAVTNPEDALAISWPVL